MITLNQIETKVFLQTRLRNLKRKNAKLSQHPELTEEYSEINREIKDIEEQLNLLN